jgi:hypothetical protein
MMSDTPLSECLGIRRNWFVFQSKAGAERSLCYAPRMHQRRFLLGVGILIVTLITMLLVEKYRECKELGYTDCPRKGRALYPDHKKLLPQ